ncbi:hypothetical protein BCR42DRAFT_430618 [Absidia repens]|uniref:Secreted protein n=1 Tax=Absidia repens TaxID=90262 RepID=A0A1X2H969_9FUNG|nr:hypothetical protein BCR42DRAFT_430618 [Absidia repens]
MSAAMMLAVSLLMLLCCCCCCCCFRYRRQGKSIDLCWFNKNIVYNTQTCSQKKEGFYNPIETVDNLVVKKTFVLSFIC